MGECMAKPIEYFVDDKPYSTFNGNQSVAEILAVVGLDPDRFFLISKDRTEYRDPGQIVSIHSGDRFVTKRKGRPSKPPSRLAIHYKVNGEQQVTDKSPLSMEHILRAAGKSASIDPSQLENYVLENIKTGEKYQNLSDMIDINNDDQFLAIHSGAYTCRQPYCHMTPIESIHAELKDLGVEPEIVSGGGFIQNHAVTLIQQVQTGRFRGTTFTLAIGFQEDSYPNYPPHFIYVADLPDERFPVHVSFYHDNRHWKGFSLPPSDFWDFLPASEKNMKTYVNRHLLRFWAQI